MAYISELHCYPVKSCAGIDLEEATFTETGIAFDRQWMISDAEYTFRSQRQNPELALVNTRLTDTYLYLAAPGMEEIEIDLADVEQSAVMGIVHGQDAPAIRQSVEADEWVSEYLGESSFFLRKNPNADRLVKPEYQRSDVTNKVAFADGASSLLTTVPSLRALNERLERPVIMNRFRPNLVADGQDLEAFDEDYWRRLLIGEVAGDIVWACARCMITETDQATAVQGKEVLKALQSFRKGVNAVNPSKKGVFFGQNFLHRLAAGNTIAVGDDLQMVERSSERNILGLAN